MATISRAIITPVDIELLTNMWKFTLGDGSRISYFYKQELRGAVYTDPDGTEYVEFFTKNGNVSLFIIDFTVITPTGFTAATPEDLINELITTV